MRERNRLLKDQVQDAHWYLALETQMARAGAEVHANRCFALERISEAQAHSQTAFPTATLALVGPDGVQPASEDELKSAFSDGRPRDLNAGRALVGPHRSDLEATFTAKGVPARDCSTGEQKALLISLVLANARALTQDIGAPPILLLDEVAAHLDRSRRAALYDEICAIGAQAWMTGTEHDLFAELADRAQHFEVSEGGDGSTVSRIS